MLKKSVREFRDFLEQKIKATENCSSLSDSEKSTRLQTLYEIADLEIIDEVYDRHDMDWLLREAVYERVSIESKIKENKSRYSLAYLKYEGARKRIATLTETLKKYRRGLDDSGSCINESDVTETIRELSEEIEAEKEIENGSFLIWKEELAFKKISDALHKLMGILKNPDGYFWYLREA